MVKILTKTHQSLLSHFGKIHRMMVKTLESRLSSIGMTYQEMRIAGLLMGEHNMTQKALAEKLCVRAATLSVAISKLEAQGLVNRVQSKTDKRVNYLQVVPNKKISKVDDILNAVEADITRGIPKRDLQVTAQVITQIIDNLQAQQGA